MLMQSIEICGLDFDTFIPESDLEKAIGLSNHSFLASNQAMLFQNPGEWFNTSKMQFSIDILCFNDDGNCIQKIVNCKPGISSIHVCKESKYVVELRHGALEERLAEEKNGK